MKLVLATLLAMTLFSEAPQEGHTLEGRVVTANHVIPEGLIVEVEGSVCSDLQETVFLHAETPGDNVICLRLGQSLEISSQLNNDRNFYSPDFAFPFDAGVSGKVSIRPTTSCVFTIYDSLHAAFKITVVVSEAGSSVAKISTDGSFHLTDLPRGINCLNFRTVLGRPRYGQASVEIPQAQCPDIPLP